MEEFSKLVQKRHYQLSRASCCAMKKVLDQRSRLFALNVPEFTSLSSNDQVILQEENGGPLIELRIATFFHTEIKARQQLGLILGQSDVLRLTSSLGTYLRNAICSRNFQYVELMIILPPLRFYVK